MIKIGIIGTGRIAKEHAKAISMVSGAALIAAADSAPERLCDFCSEFPISRQYDSAANLIADPEVDLVTITTPPSAHETPAVAALEQGKFVFCEKPLAHSLASAVRIAKAETAHAGRLAVSYQMRYESSFRRLSWLCRNGWIGKIQSVTIERHSYIPHADHGKGGWWGAWNVAGGGVLMTQLIHEIDLLLQLIGRPISVKAEMDTRFSEIESEDYAEAIVRFAGGETARCIASVNSGSLGNKFVVHGSSGSVGLPWQLTFDDSGRQTAAIKELNLALPDTCARKQSVLNRGFRFIGRRLGMKEQPFEVTPHARLYAEIVRSLKSSTPLPIPPIEAMSSLELCMAAYDSAISGKEIGIPVSPTSTVYDGVSKADYNARKCSRQDSTERAVI